MAKKNFYLPNAPAPGQSTQEASYVRIFKKQYGMSPDEYARMKDAGKIDGESPVSVGDGVSSAPPAEAAAEKSYADPESVGAGGAERAAGQEAEPQVADVPEPERAIRADARGESVPVPVKKTPGNRDLSLRDLFSADFSAFSPENPSSFMLVVPQELYVKIRRIAKRTGLRPVQLCSFLVSVTDFSRTVERLYGEIALRDGLR